MPPVEPNDEERQEELPQDNQTPFNPATPTADDSGQPAKLDPTHPVTDSNIQPEEVYEEGVPGAAEASEPNAGNDVTAASPTAPSDDNPDDNEDPNPEIEDTAL
jgi:hypothetical protein